MTMKTSMKNKHTMQKERIENDEWFLIDAKDMVLGRLASELATRLRGKHKAIYTPHVDCGDRIIVINAEKIRVTGNKLEDKLYHRHTGYPGGIKSPNYKEVLAKDPTKPLRKAVVGMLPKGPLGREMALKLKIYAGAEHPQIAQKSADITDEITAKLNKNRGK